jgi:hypothetical protein
MTLTLEKATEVLGDCQRAYLLVFGDKDKEAAIQAVLADLTMFCRANETCVVPGDRDRTYVLEGRREVFLRIQDHLKLTTEQLVEKYTRPAKGAISHDRTYPSDPA